MKRKHSQTKVVNLVEIVDYDEHYEVKNED